MTNKEPQKHHSFIHSFMFFFFSSFGVIFKKKSPCKEALVLIDILVWEHKLTNNNPNNVITKHCLQHQFTKWINHVVLLIMIMYLEITKFVAT